MIFFFFHVQLWNYVSNVRTLLQPRWWKIIKRKLVVENQDLTMTDMIWHYPDVIMLIHQCKLVVYVIVTKLKCISLFECHNVNDCISARSKLGFLNKLPGSISFLNYRTVWFLILLEYLYWISIQFFTQKRIYQKKMIEHILHIAMVFFICILKCGASFCWTEYYKFLLFCNHSY